MAGLKVDMARNKKKKALYEVIGKASSSPKRGRGEEDKQPGKQIKEQRREGQGTAQIRQGAGDWPNRPRLIQLNEGRIEMSVPYEAGAAVLLAFILLIVVAFQAGKRQVTAGGDAAAEPGVKQPVAGAKPGPSEMVEPRSEPDTSDSSSGAAAAIESTAGGLSEGTQPAGDHVIVIQEFGRKRDLVPVQKHFAENDITTRIVQQGGRYFLVTAKTFDNPHNSGTNGHKMLERIREVGTRYKNKAPEGFETFAPNYFRDAYGKKIR